MKVQTTKELYYVSVEIPVSTQFDIELDDSLFIKYDNEAGLCIEVDYNGKRYVPVSCMKPVSPYDVQTTDCLLSILKEIENIGKVMFVDSTVRFQGDLYAHDWAESDSFFLLCRNDLVKMQTDNNFRFERNVYGSIVEEAVRDMEIVRYYLSRGTSGVLSLTKIIPDGSHVSWTIHSKEIVDAFILFNLPA